MKKSTILVILFLVSMFAGCAGTRIPANAPSNSILIQDEFENSKWGWDTMNDPSGSLVSFAGGGLRILVNQSNHDYWTSVHQVLPDARIEVDAIKLGGADDNSFGILCRYQNRENYYAFLASSDGYGGIIKMDSGKISLIHASQMEFSPAITRGSASNRLRADCIGQELTFYVNGQQVARARDAEFSTGEVGLIAGANATPVVDILFDHFVVIKP